ncbi:hypothetical protein C1645_811741 [Glomus cerebriforme]|uniref:Uncharacterized protein n=1 Tax=Glomus cerebriforme TaxID=658196 RepID=A0A397TMR4_9GLOM|nr:hypothetical protein C1645_811741 [Glomus cerebriforme]
MEEREELNPDCIAVTVKHSPSRMFWGCFSWCELGLIVPLKDSVIGQTHVKIIYNYVIPTLDKHFPSKNMWAEMKAMVRRRDLSPSNINELKKYVKDMNPLSYTIPPKEAMSGLSFYLMIACVVFPEPSPPLRYETQDLVMGSQIDRTDQIFRAFSASLYEHKLTSRPANVYIEADSLRNINQNNLHLLQLSNHTFVYLVREIIASPIVTLFRIPALRRYRRSTIGVQPFDFSHPSLF